MKQRYRYSLIILFVVVVCFRYKVFLNDHLYENSFLYVGTDGNIYSGTTKNAYSKQMTRDGSLEQPYKFAGMGNPVSPNGDFVLIQKGSDFYLFNVNTKKVVFIEKEVEYAAWSPDGEHIVLVTFTGNQNYQGSTENYLQPRTLKIVDNSGALIQTWEGYAPAWKNNYTVIFIQNWFSESKTTIFQKLSEITIDGDVTETRQEVCSFMKPILYTETSETGKYLLVDSSFERNLGYVNLSLTDTVCTNWSSYLNIDGINQFVYPSYSWSPTNDDLVVCTQLTNMEQYLEENSLSVILIKPDEQVIEFNDPRCYYTTRISWRGDGKYFTYLNSNQSISIIDTQRNDYVHLKSSQADVKYLYGPWYSPDGGKIAAIDEADTLYVNDVDDVTIQSTLIAKAIDFVWLP